MPKSIRPAAAAPSPFRHQFLRHDFPPIRVTIDDIIVGADMTIRGRIDPARALSAFDGMCALEQEASQRNDRLVGQAEMLLRAVDDRTHALLQSKILGVGPCNTGEGRGLLKLPIDKVVVDRFRFRRNVPESGSVRRARKRPHSAMNSLVRAAD